MMPDLRRKDHTHGERAAGVTISERDPLRQFKRALNTAISENRKTQEKLDKAIAIGEALIEATKN